VKSNETMDTYGVSKKQLITRAAVLERYANATDLPNQIRNLQEKLTRRQALLEELQAAPSEIQEVYLAALKEEEDSRAPLTVGGRVARRIISHMFVGTMESNWHDLLSGRLRTLITTHVNWELKQKGINSNGTVG